MQQVLDNLKEMPSGPGAQDIDLIFLRGIIESPIVRSLAKVGHTQTLTHTHQICALCQGIEQRNINQIWYPQCVIYCDGTFDFLTVVIC